VDAALFQSLIWAVPCTGLLALIFAFFKSASINKNEVGTDRMKEISGYIREGAMAFLAREYRVLAIFAVVVAVLLAVANWSSETSSPLVAVSFLTGAFCSGLAGYIGMRVATAANVRTTHAARTGLNEALRIAFSGGTVMGMSVVGLAVIGLCALMIGYSGMFGQVWAWQRILTVVSGFSLGASSIALFARVGGGIYTKAADVGADLVGKVEAGIPEDDPRNPAVIADNVGDNVGDVAGMGADLFESYVAAIVSAMVLAATADPSSMLPGILFPLAVAGLGIVVSIIGTFFVRTKEGGNPQAALNLGTFGAAGIMIVVIAWLSWYLLPEGITLGGVNYAWTGVFGAVIAGLIAGTLIGLSTEYYTSEARGPARSIAEDSQTGAATNIIGGARPAARRLYRSCLPSCWPLRYCHRRTRHAVDHRYPARGGRLRAGGRQRRRHRRNE
jgi:K(+)-stimulated pyrophosphate-energized sodium pump